MGEFSLSCSLRLGEIDCKDKPTSDILVAGRGTDLDDPADDRLQVWVGNGQETGFSNTDSPEVRAPRGAGVLLLAGDQPVCADPSTASPPFDPQVRFDNDNRSSVVAVFEPGRTTIDIYLVGGQHTCMGGANPGANCTGTTDVSSCTGGGICRLISRLVPPPGHPDPLPVANPLVDAAFVDLNRDDVLDLVAVSSGGYPSSPNITIYLGIADGLFFTDPSLNPAGVPDGAAAITTGNVNLVSDFTYPEVVLLNGQDDAPMVLTNVLTERADIDRSGRVDGFDLAILARAFGATRGEDFIILGPGDPEVALDPALDGTLKQSAEPPGTAYRRLVMGSATQRVGQDLPDFAGICDGALDRLEGLYGLPADVNLDGIVDGEDLAFIASLFGRGVPR
ncbi:MAG: hypothetical protein HY510_05715 [Acidobacteria bacterium]|nr:hypothetical protein [Acidobacteriota bacterium]